MEEMCQYLDNVASGRIPVANHNIIYQIQDMLNLRPDLDVSELITAFNIKSNDQMMVTLHSHHSVCLILFIMSHIACTLCYTIQHKDDII
jgi:hypothetical protein